MSSFTPMKLNTDILYLICDHLRSSPSDLARFALVHPSWTNPAQAQLYRRIAISSPKLNHASTVRMKRLLRTAEQEKRLARGVRGVIVSTIGGAETVAAFERLLMLCTEVVDVALEGCTNATLPFFLDALIRTSINITSLTITPHDRTDAQYLPSSASLSASHLASRLSSFHHLRQLNLTHFTSSSENSWPSTHLSTLTHLTLTSCHFRPHDLRPLLSPSLTHLSLSLHYRNSTDPSDDSLLRTDLINLLQPLHSTLRHLTLDKLPWFDAQPWAGQDPTAVRPEPLTFFSLEPFKNLKTVVFASREWKGLVGGEGSLRRVEVSAAVADATGGMVWLRRMVAGGVEVWITKGARTPLEKL